MASPSKPRILVIGAGSRGNAYARPIHRLGLAEIAAVCEPDEFKRQVFGQQYIWGGTDEAVAAETKLDVVGSGSIDTHGAGVLKGDVGNPLPGQEFAHWEDWIQYEVKRRERVAAGAIPQSDPEARGIDAVIVACMDEMHVAVCKALAHLSVHILCEKPLATRLEDVVDIYRTFTEQWRKQGHKTIFSICHVLRYSPHNMMLKRLAREEGAIGDILSVEHIEPVGYWHFSHSYVRGNWRRSDMTAPSLLTKSCHDIDFLLWLLCSPTSSGPTASPHNPSKISSTGRLNLFRRARKPAQAGQATNCFSCPIEQFCIYSAKRVYIDQQFENGNVGWPVKIVLPDIEDTMAKHGKDVARQKLADALKEDYDDTYSSEQISSRNWFGRCVWESDNDVCDDQHVTITWNDDLAESASTNGDHPLKAQRMDRLAKTATFHMISSTDAICERRGRIYGTTGEIVYNSRTITIHDFTTNETRVLTPPRASDDGGGEAGHGGGDTGLAMQFIKAVKAAMGADTTDDQSRMSAEDAQRRFLGCSLEEVVKSHVAVFAAEESRMKRDGGAIDWKEWYDRHMST